MSKWILVCRKCRKEKRVYASACIHAQLCDACLPDNPNPELARLERLQDAAK
jgi:hypothetical protein